MKNVNYTGPKVPAILFFMVFLIGILFASCAKTVRFKTSQIVPAAVGYVKVDRDENKNYSIAIKLSNLADPTRLYPARQTYVVWIETESNGLKNLGQLRSSRSIFSSALEGTLNTVTPFKPTKVFITAEDQAMLQNPGGQTILETRDF